MSGAKTGTVAAAPAALLLPIIGAGAVIGLVGLAAIGVVGAASSGIGMAAKGIFRLGKKTYDAIDETIENAVAKDLEQKMAYLNSIRAKDVKTTSISEDIPNISMDILAEKERQEKNYNAFIEHIKNLADERERIEKEKGLKHYVSMQFRQEVEKFIKQKEQIKQSLSPIEKQITKNDFAKEFDGVYKQIESIQPFFPLFAQDKYKQLKDFQPNESNFSTLETELKEKTALLQGWRQDSCLKLSKRYFFMLSHPLYCQLEKHEQKEFLNSYITTLNGITSSRCNSEEKAEIVIQEFYTKTDSLVKRAREIEMESRFTTNLDLLKQAMNKKNYTLVDEQDENEIIKLTFQSLHGRGDSKKIFFSLKKAEVENSDIDDFSMEVDSAGFKTEEERNSEGKAVMQELESMGIQVEYYDLTAPLVNEKNFEAIKQIIKKRLAAQNIHNVDINFDTNSSISVGDKIYDANTRSIQYVVGDYLNKAGIKSAQNISREKVRESI